MTEEKQNFGTDVSRLLEIVAHALYSNRDVFLRELISNAADACDRLRYEALQKPELSAGELAIRVFRTPDVRTLTVLDNGIGMARQDLIDNLGTIARSGTAALVEQVKAAGKDSLSLIGQFGVGFYASFMVASRVEVISRRAGEAQAWHWESDGRTGFTVREAKADEAEKLSAGHGTAVILHINDVASEYLLDHKLQQIIATWSDHIGFPIYLGKDADKPVNQASALWTRPKQDITPEQYTEFYHHVGHGMDDPLLTSHWRAEGKIEYTALLFVPTLRPFDLYDPTRRHAVRLYVRRVFITDDCEGLIYPWLRFLRGVVDSADLPLNVSREMLQHNPMVARLRNGIAKRILSDLHKLSTDDAPAFASFWGQFGAVLKEGLYDATEHRDDLLQVARFYSTQSESLTSLSDYVSRMKPEQDVIYYLSGENLENLRNSPQIEGFKSRGVEVLFFTDTIDDFWLQAISDFQGKTFKSVTKGIVDLDKFKSAGTDKKDKKTVTEEKTPEIQGLIAALKKALTQEIGDVRTTNRLTDSPVCLMAGDDEVDLRMERVLRIHQKYEAPVKRVLEINPAHALIKKLAALAASDNNQATIEDAAHLLLDQARIIQGEPVPDPTTFARRMAKIMELGLAA